MQRIISDTAATVARKLVQENPLNERLFVQYDVQSDNFGKVILTEMGRLSTEQKKMIRRLTTRGSVIDRDTIPTAENNNKNNYFTNNPHTHIPQQPPRAMEIIVPMIDSGSDWATNQDVVSQITSSVPSRITDTEPPAANNSFLSIPGAHLNNNNNNNNNSHTNDTAPYNAERTDGIRHTHHSGADDSDIMSLLTMTPDVLESNVKIQSALRQTEKEQDEDVETVIQNILDQSGPAPPPEPHQAALPNLDSEPSDAVDNMVTSIHREQHKREESDKDISSIIDHIHKFEKNERQKSGLGLRGGDAGLLAVLAAYIEGLQAIWRLFTEAALSEFRSTLYDRETGEFLYPSISHLISQLTMVDLDFSDFKQVAKVVQVNKHRDFEEKKKLMTYLRNKRKRYIERICDSPDLCKTLVPAGLLYLKSKSNLVERAIRWVSSNYGDRKTFLRTLLHKADVHDLKTRFVADQNMFDTPLAKKHVNDYYRLVLQQHLELAALGNGKYKGMSVDSHIFESSFDPDEIVVALTDLDPSSPRMGFLLSDACKLLIKSRDAKTIEAIVQIAKKRLDRADVVLNTILYRSRVAQRRVYMVKRLGVQVLGMLRKMPPSVLCAIGT